MSFALLREGEGSLLPQHTVFDPRMFLRSFQARLKAPPCQEAFSHCDRLSRHLLLCGHASSLLVLTAGSGHRVYVSYFDLETIPGLRMYISEQK